jgi:hypothetical protein
MYKKLENELKDLAQEILQLKDFNDVDVLREKAHNLYEKLFEISFFNKHISDIKSISLKNSQTLDRLNSSINELKSQEIPLKSEPIEKNEELEGNEELNAFFEPKFDSVKEDFSQKEEFKDTISLDETEKLFKTKKVEEKQLSLHDKFLSNSIQIGLNDRIAFVNNLFNYSQAEFNKTLSILNDCKTKHEAINYIHQTVKSRYNWQGKEELEERFLVIIERKFI